FAHPTVPIRITKQCTGSTRVRPEWSFGWNHDQKNKLTVPELVFPDHLDILRTIVEPDLAWVVKYPKTDMHSHPANHPQLILVVSQHTTFFLWWLVLDRGYIKSHSASLDDHFNPSQFQKCHLPSRSYQTPS
ncbi:hypothetical protein IGI04_023474, partial [Brassica rapa subsp. trilocularis]